MKKFVKSTLVLVCICSVMALLLALTNSITAPIIKKNDQAAANEALLVVMPDGENFEPVDLSSYTLPETVAEAYKEAKGGYVIKLTTTGYSSGFVIMCGISPEGTIVGTTILSSNETPSIGGTAAEQLSSNIIGKDMTSIDSVDTITGATKTTLAYRSAIKDALNAVIILGGGSVDLRTEEEILADNLAAALPAAESKFTKLFIVEVINGIDAIYKADNGKGFVCVVGDTFVGVDENGAVISDVTTDVATNISAQLAIINATKTTSVEVPESAKGVNSILKTATGNYIIEVRGAGYGIKGGNDYHPASGEYIVVKVSMTKDGKIIDCLTVSQAESKGIGDACADEKFYGQFVGKTESDYKNIDAISGATMTTDGYKQAIERAFAAVKILEGGTN